MTVWKHMFHLQQNTNRNHCNLFNYAEIISSHKKPSIGLKASALCAVTLKLYTYEAIHTILTLHLDLHQKTTLAITKWRVHQYIFSSHIVVCNFWFSMSIKKSASTINRLLLYIYCTGCCIRERYGI